MTMAEQPAKTVKFELADPAVAKDPGPYFRELRDKCPVARSEDLGGFWAISRYDDVSKAALTPTTFISGEGVAVPKITGRPGFPLLDQDDPEHSAYRSQIQGWFTRGRMNQLENQVRDLVTRLIDGVIEDGRCDIAKVLAEPVPSIVTAMLMGLPERDWPWFRQVSEDSIRLGIAGDVEGATAAMEELNTYIARSLEDRRTTPTEDLLTDLVNLKINGEPIAHDEAVLLAVFILQAGHETTVGALGGMLYHLARTPDLRDRLINEPQLLQRAVDEALRLEPPLPGMGRVTSKDVSIGDAVVPSGDRVMLLFASANRDGDVFQDPETFSVDRANSHRHLSFGLGVHRCVGVHLATLEMRVVLEEVLRRMPRITLVNEDDVTVEYTFTRAFRSVPVSW